MDKREEIRLIYAQKIKSISNNFKTQIDSSYNFSLGSNFEEMKATVIQKLKLYIDNIFQINPEIWMAYRKEFPLLIEENVFADFHSNKDLKSFQAKTNNILSIVKNKAVVFCDKKMKL